MCRRERGWKAISRLCMPGTTDSAKRQTARTCLAQVEPSRLFDGRRILIYTHRWLGIAGCLVFFVWFVSGVVMMYARMPRLTPEERLARLSTLDPSRIVVPLDVAAGSARDIDRTRLAMLG